ncbi:GNVR domain-containing protein [Natronoflexus pectinivorans]|uniref:Putative tyrosine kinase-like protein n=1 Tax=Natronoflexus pectinivorans TaxID=682526 RepID=A0A4R2GI37_9BACT|nr:GNVR domain-containing protein [Natronoflexus pectinivorans]TCO07870.1 putative tyrosine kinase-like protein [Natronoflexus pectinivorans]
MENQKIKKNPPPIIKDDEIDLVALGLHIWNGRMLIIKTVAVFVVLGLVIALTSPEEYTSRVKLIPETGKRTGLGSLGGLASQFGLGNISAATETGSIPTEYYPEIVHSLPFLKSLMNYETYIPEVGERMTLFEYYSEPGGGSVLSYIKAYTIGLPRTIIGWIRGAGKDAELSAVDSGSHVTRLSEDEWEVLERLKDNISLEINREGIISITVKSGDPVLAADMADKVTSLLSEYILEYKTDKAREDLEFVEARHIEAGARFEKAQEQLARFRDASRGQMTAMAQTEEQRLQSEYDLAFNVYNTLARQLEESRLKLQEETPVVKVLEPAVVPKERSAPRRGMIMVVSVFLGGFIGLGILFGSMVWVNLRKKMEEYG